MREQDFCVIRHRHSIEPINDIPKRIMSQRDYAGTLGDTRSTLSVDIPLLHTGL